MLRRIRDIFLTQYIGAIVIGLVGAQGITDLIHLIIFPVAWKLAAIHNEMNPNAFSNPAFDWTQQIVSLVNVLLHFGVALILIRWLYADRKQTLLDAEAPRNPKRD